MSFLKIREACWLRFIYFLCKILSPYPHLRLKCVGQSPIRARLPPCAPARGKTRRMDDNDQAGIIFGANLQL